jgi:hypothetical protein
VAVGPVHHRGDHGWRALLRVLDDFAGEIDPAEHAREALEQTAHHRKMVSEDPNVATAWLNDRKGSITSRRLCTSPVYLKAFFCRVTRELG